MLLRFGLGLANGRIWQESTQWEWNEVGGVSLVLLFINSQRLGSVPLVKAMAPGGQVSGDLKQWSHFPSYPQEVTALTLARLGIFSHPFLIRLNPTLSFVESLC